MTHAHRVVVVLPLGDFPTAISKKIADELKASNSQIILRPNTPIPANTYYAPRNRYRADKLISYLKDFGSADTVIIGLTNKDISTTNGTNQDWGIMGLAYTPGNACVISTFRVSKTNLYNQFYKVAIHELGHTQGLPHCPVKNCFMRDATGGNRLDEENGFCISCRSFLIKKGWRL